MAQKRMFTMKIVDSDEFLELPATAQNLYFHLNMRADDDGFLNNPKRIMRDIRATEDDLKILLAKRFLLAFENGVIVIKHWRMHNTIQKDRYTPTQYQEELAMLGIKHNNSYTLDGDGNPIIRKKETKQLTAAQQKRLDAKKDSELPYYFDNTIRIAFIGRKCPICGVIMSQGDTQSQPTIQHNIPISLGGKHEIDNISVICRSCNSSIQNRKETPAYNTEEVKRVWECFGNVSTDIGLDIGLDLDIDKGLNTPPIIPPSGGSTPKPSKPKKKSKAEASLALLEDELQTRHFPDSIVSCLGEWMQYKAESHNDSYQPRGMKALLTQVEKAVSKYGERAVQTAFETSMANGWKGLFFDKLEQQKQKTSNPFLDILREENGQS